MILYKMNHYQKMAVNLDVRIVSSFLKCGKFLGVSPIITHKEKPTTVSHVIYNLYVLILLNAVVFGSIYSIFNRFNGFWKENTISQVILECLEVLSELLFMVSNFLGALRYGPNWKQVLKNLTKVDKALGMTKSATNVYWYMCKILIFHLAYVVLHAYELLMWISKSSSQVNEYGYILYRIIMYYQFFVTIFALEVIGVLRSRFLELQKLLDEVSLKRVIIISQNDNQYVLGKLLRLRKLYGILYEMQQNVNLIFSYSIFYGTMSCILIILGDLNYIVEFAHTSDENFNIGVSFVNFLYAFYYSSATVSIVMSCDRMESISPKMVKTCYLYKDIFEKSTISNEFISLAEYVEKMAPTFTAAGFFKVNQQLLSTFISAIISYFIIIIQFNLRFQIENL